MWTVVELVCSFIILYWLVKHAFPARPNPEKQKLEQDQKHNELVAAIERVGKRASTTDVPAKTFHQEPPVAEPVTVVATGETDGAPYTRYSDGSVEVAYPEGRVRYYGDGSIETQTAKGIVRLRTAADMLTFISENQLPSGTKVA